MSSQPVTKRFSTLWAFLAYCAIAIAITWPLILRMTDAVPNDLGDPLLVGWILWWNAHAVPLTDTFWNAPMFYPAPGVLAFSEHFVGLSIVTTPIYWLTGNIQLGYNVVLLLTFALSGFFAYLLCRAVTGREDAAFIGGLIYGFMPYRVDQLPHMQMLVSCWMPFGLWGLHRYLQTKHGRWLAVFAIGWLMQGLSSGYLMFFFAVLVGLWVVWFVRWHEWRQWLAIGGVWALASVPIAALMLGYRRIHEVYGFERGLHEIQFYSADMTGLFQASVNLLAWKWLSIYPHAEGAIFPGITAALIVVTSLAVVRTRAFQLWGPLKRTHVIVGGLTLVFAAASASARWLPWQFPALGLSNTHVDKPLRFGALCLLVWIVTHPWFAGGFKRRSAFGFYLAAAVLMWMLCLGPTPLFFGEKTPFTGPYSLLLDLPGFNSIRVPARFAMCTGLCLACAGAIAYGRMAATFSRPLRIATAALAGILALMDGWVLLTIEKRPEPWPIQSSLTAGAVIELPIGEGFADIQAMHRQTFSGNPIVNGYSGNFPHWYTPLVMGLQRHDGALLGDLSAMGVRQVMVDMQVESGKAWATYFATRPDITLVKDDGAHRLYRLPEADRPLAVRELGAPLRVAAIDVTVNPKLIAKMTDGDLGTRWQTGPQKGDEQVTFDLGATQPVGGVVLYMGEFTTDAPRDLLVEISEDRQRWTTIFRGPGESGVFRAVLRDPKRTPFTFDLGDRPARFIRFSQLGSDKVWYWSIAEFAVLGPK